MPLTVSRSGYTRLCLSYAAGVGNGDGAFLGPVRVTLQHFVPGIDPDKPTPPPPPRPDIPDRYRTVDKTSLTAEVVTSKNNVIDFKLD